MGDAYADIPKQGGNFAKAVAACINSHQCESRGKQLMCPSFRISGNPNLSTGGRVRLLKAALNADLIDQALDDPELAEAMAQCVACKGCKRECEANVDMALIKAEYLAQRAARQGLSRRSQLFAAWPRWLHHWPWLRHLILWRNRSRLLSALGERWLGISASRRLPQPSAHPFSDQAPIAKKSNQDLPELMLLVDTFSHTFEPDIAEAALSVLRAGGYWVQVAYPDEAEEPDRPLSSGRTFLAQGLIDQARAEASRLLQSLQPHAKAGRLLVGLEPSCVLGLRDDAQALELGDELNEIGKSVFLFEEFLAKELMAKRLQLPLKSGDGRKLLVHGHCHQKAVGAMKSVRKVLKLIPGLDFEMIDASCCGMAGTFGLEAEHAALSMAMAEQDLMPALRAQPEAKLLANGFSCREQIQGLGGPKGQHLAQLLRDHLSFDAAPFDSAQGTDD
jgi:Fe-S oxidoreductase